jgi:two-component system cell cycle sensor histidine kinase/response regulator CckA
MKKTGVIPVLLITAVLSLAVMTVYEMTKQLLWPNVSIWESHIITILVVSVFITGLVFFTVRGRQKRLTEIVQTMRQQAELERRLRKAEAEKDLVLNSISEIVAYQDTELRVLWANQAAADLVQKPLNEVMGLSCKEIFAHSPEQCAVCPVQRALQSGRTEEGNIQFDNGRTWLVRAHAVRNNGDAIKGIVTVASDITAMQAAREEHRQFEIKMFQAQKLESLGVLAGGIAHDFNNLLVGILGNADLAMSELDRDVSPRKTLESIKQSSLRAADLTNQMLAFSGKGSFLVKPLHLNDLIVNMTHLLESALSAGTKIRFDLGENLPEIEGDEMQLRQVVMNLVVNAVESIDRYPGEIHLRTYSQCFSRNDLDAPHAGDPVSPGEYFVLEVSDTGCGMNDETREKLFDPFFTTKFQGRGLGLAAVLGIVRGHGGIIFVSSKPGKGSMFRVLLPFEAPPPRAFRPGSFRAP